MKNVIKKISAFAMAFALLGTSTAVINNVAPASNTTITAKALGTPTVSPNTPHGHGQYTEWVDDAGYWATETYYTTEWRKKKVGGHWTYYSVQVAHTKQVYHPVYHLYCKACCKRV